MTRLRSTENEDVKGVSLNIQLSYLLSLTRALFTFDVARVPCLNLNRIAMMHVA